MSYTLTFKLQDKVITWFMSERFFNGVCFILGLLTGTVYVGFTLYRKRQLALKAVKKPPTGGDLVSDIQYDVIYRSIDKNVNNKIRQLLGKYVGRLVVDHRVFLLASYLASRNISIELIFVTITAPNWVEVIRSSAIFVTGTVGVPVSVLCLQALSLTPPVALVASITILASVYFGSPWLSGPDINRQLERLPTVEVVRSADDDNVILPTHWIDPLEESPNAIYVRDEQSKKHSIPGTFEYNTEIFQKKSTTEYESVSCKSTIEDQMIKTSCSRPSSYEEKYGPLQDRTFGLSDLKLDNEAMTAVIQENPATKYESKVEQFKKRRERIHEERVRNRESQSNVDDNLYTADNFE